MYKISRRIIVLFFVLGVAASASVRAQGDEDWRPRPCQLFGQSDTIFVGLAVSINEEINAEGEPWVVIEFRTSEAFKGVGPGKNVVVRSSAFFADEIGVAVGRTFLVYASSGHPDALNLNVATKVLGLADKELSYLRGLSTVNSGTNIFGKVRLIAKSRLKKDHTQPFTSGIVKVEQSQDDKVLLVRETKTDADGRYEMQGLPAGDYRIEAVIPETGDLYGYSQFFSAGGTGCVRTDIDIKTANKVSGKVIDPDGKPVEKVPLELIPYDFEKPAFDVDNGADFTNSNDDGTFEFLNVPPGKYVLAINYTILPEKESPYPTSFAPGTASRSKAEVIEISPGREIEGIEFVLGPQRLIEKKITGRVAFADGRPSAGTTVYLKEDENVVCCVLEKAETDAQGNFTLVGFAGRKYRIWAFIDHKPFTDRINFIAASPVFVMSDEARPHQLILQPTGKSSLDALDEIEMRERGRVNR